MAIRRLTLTGFKNYGSLELSFSNELNCIVGRNGSGKTNLLDAIYYLCMCKSYFPVSDREIVKIGDPGFRITGQFNNGDEEMIVAIFQPGKKKIFERNKVAYSRLSEHVGLLPVVMIAPDDTDLIKGGSERRRRFMDNTLSQIDRRYLEALLIYNKVLGQRNALLKRNGTSQALDYKLLSTYDNQLADPAEYLYQRRMEFVSEIAPDMMQLYKSISKDQESINLEYVSNLHDHSLMDLLLRSREKDVILQRTTEGLHKDDLRFLIDQGKVKSFASQGQRKSFLLALKLAQSDLFRKHTKKAPILLLDDIFDKLDVDRVKQLIVLLSESEFGQIFITDTHEDRIDDIVKPYGGDYQIIRINNGKIDD